MTLNRSRKIITQLFEMAQDSEIVCRARVVSAIVYQNKIIAYGFNQVKTHPMAAKFSKHPGAHSLHAEVAAIRNCIRKYGPDILKKSTIFVARAKQSYDNSEFSWGMSKPCVGCTKAIKTFKIPKVVYTTENENEIGVIFNDFN